MNEKLYIPIANLIGAVAKMKLNLDGLPLEYHARVMNTNINNDLDYIIKELEVILTEAVTHMENSLNGYDRDDAECFMGRPLTGEEWFDLSNEILNCDPLWDQIAEFADDWMTDNIIAKEEK